MSSNITWLRSGRVVTAIARSETHDPLRGRLLAVVAPIDMKARRVEMAIGGGPSETVGRAGRNQAVEFGDAIAVERIKGAAQGIIVELLGGHARRNESVGGLILEEHGNQIEGLIDKAQAVEDHGFDGFSHGQVTSLRVLLGGLIQAVANA